MAVKKTRRGKELKESRTEWIYTGPINKRTPEWAETYQYIKTIPMNTKQQQAQVNAQLKAQKDIADNEFRRNARIKALETAERLNPNRTFIVNKQDKPIAYDVTKEAEKIYQWIIKVI